MTSIESIALDIAELIAEVKTEIASRLRRVIEIDAELSRPMGATIGNQHYEDWRDIQSFDGGGDHEHELERFCQVAV